MNRKTFLVALLLGACSLSSYADDPLVKMKLHLQEDPAQSSPLTQETEHYLTPTEITHKQNDDGTWSVVLHVQYEGDEEDHTVEYPLAYCTGSEGVDFIIHDSGAPTIHLSANQDPDHRGNYYTTFYSGLEAYTLPEGVTAYAATVDENGAIAYLEVVAEGGVSALPKNAAVVLHTKQSGGITVKVDAEGDEDDSAPNAFSGVNLRTSTDGDGQKYHIFTYGHKGLGFYYKKDTNALLANKAFIHPDNVPAGISAFALIFPDEEHTTGIIQPILDKIAESEGNIYSVSGVQLSKPQQGVNIVGGKKVLIK